VRELADLAEAVGADDLFVLHRVDKNRLVNLDGAGRGAGWAGNIDVDPAAEPWVARAFDEGIVRIKSGIPSRIFGPYWASEAVAVAEGDDLVLFGGEGTTVPEDTVLADVARRAASRVGDVPVAKHLADELEVSQAALAIATLRPASVEEAAVAIATSASRALSCEFGVVLLKGPPIRLFLAEEGWRPVADNEEIIAALLPLGQAVQSEPLVEQDLSCSAFPYPPLAFDDGLIARLAISLGPGGSLGLLVIAHAAGAPRGFTALCQRVAATIARTAEAVLEEALRAEQAERRR
jgi:hypothetical protein